MERAPDGRGLTTTSANIRDGSRPGAGRGRSDDAGDAQAIHCLDAEADAFAVIVSPMRGMRPRRPEDVAGDVS